MPKQSQQEVIEATAAVVTQTQLAKREEQNVAKAELKPLYDYLGTSEYNEDRFKEEARTHVMQTGYHAFEAGVRLSVLKSEMPYGAFSKFCEEELPCTRQHAYLLIKSCHTVLQLAEKSGGAVDIRKLKAIDTQKVLSLSFIAEQPGEELQEGKIAGMTIDEIAVTPRRELVERVRQLERQMKKGEEQLREKEDKLREQDVVIRNYREYTPDSIANICRRFRTNLARDAHEFVASARAVPEADDKQLPPMAKAQLVQTLAFAQQALDEVAQLIMQRWPQANEHTHPTILAPSAPVSLGNMSGAFGGSASQGEEEETEGDEAGGDGSFFGDAAGHPCTQCHDEDKACDAECCPGECFRCFKRNTCDYPANTYKPSSKRGAKRSKVVPIVGEGKQKCDGICSACKDSNTCPELHGGAK